MQENRIPYEVTYVRSEVPPISTGECILFLVITVSLIISLILMWLEVI